MGKGDKKSKRGKIFRGTFGKRRQRKAKSYVAIPAEQITAKKEEKKIEETKPIAKVTKVEKIEKKKTTKKKSTKKGTDKE
jgi:30S ribosomal protein S31